MFNEVCDGDIYEESRRPVCQTSIILYETEPVCHEQESSVACGSLIDRFYCSRESGVIHALMLQRGDVTTHVSVGHEGLVRRLQE